MSSFSFLILWGFFSTLVYLAVLLILKKKKKNLPFGLLIFLIISVLFFIFVPILIISFLDCFTLIFLLYYIFLNGILVNWYENVIFSQKHLML